MSGPFEAVTIDPHGSTELDDAICAQRTDTGWRVEIAFPDLTDLVPSGSELDAAARAKGISRYRGGRTDPMLPRALVERASLLPGEERRVFVVTVDLDAAMETVSTSLRRDAFRSIARMTYPEATRAIKNSRDGVGDMLRTAALVARGLYERRRRSGAIALSDFDAGVVYDEEGRLAVLDPSGAPAEMTVRELMILANATLAETSAANGHAILFRNHRARPSADPGAMAEDLSLAASRPDMADTIAKRLGLVTERARLSTLLHGHFALDLPAYAWFTSPLRRYADLVNQRVLRAGMEGVSPPHDPQEMAGIAGELEAIMEAERTATADVMRSRATKDAMRMVTEGRLRDAPAEAFKRIVKVAAIGGAMTPEIAREALVRLEAGKLSSKEIARLLGTSEVAAEAAAWLVRNPSEAVSVMNYGYQALGWGLVEYAEQLKGPPHRRKFDVDATVVIDEERIESGRYTASTLRDARQLACAALIAVRLGVEGPVKRMVADEPEPVPKARKTADAANRTEDNPRNRLQEICQKRRWPMPTFDVRDTGHPGKPGNPEFEATAHLETESGRVSSRTCRATSKKAAQLAASAELLRLVDVRSGVHDRRTG